MSGGTGGNRARRGILIVDDDPLILRSLRRNLRPLVAVEVCSDALQALPLLTHQRWSLLLTDIEMPGLKGYELAERARNVDPELPVVFMTANPDSLPGCWSSCPLLTKPFRWTELLRVVAGQMRPDPPVPRGRSLTPTPP